MKRRGLVLILVVLILLTNSSLCFAANSTSIPPQYKPSENGYCYNANTLYPYDFQSFFAAGGAGTGAAIGSKIAGGAWLIGVSTVLGWISTYPVSRYDITYIENIYYREMRRSYQVPTWTKAGIRMETRYAYDPQLRYATLLKIVDTKNNKTVVYNHEPGNWRWPLSRMGR